MLNVCLEGISCGSNLFLLFNNSHVKLCKAVSESLICLIYL